jgi:hypothetical protein
MVGMNSRQMKMGLCGLATVGLLVATQGCSSSSNSGTGGAAGGGSAGAKGTGGTTGGGTGGSTVVDAGPPLCTGMAWTGAPLITNFSDVPADGGTNLRVGTQGGIYTYGGTVTTVENGALHVTGTYPASTATTAQYVGFGLYFDNCIDATAYSGFSFKLTGSLGTCDMLAIGAAFPQDQPLPPASGHGACVPTATAGCFGPGGPFTVASTGVTFASMANGSPVATVTADAKSRVTGINIGWHSPLAGAAGDGGGDAGAGGGCTVDFTIDDIAFTP